MSQETIRVAIIVLGFMLMIFETREFCFDINELFYSDNEPTENVGSLVWKYVLKLIILSGIVLFYL